MEIIFILLLFMLVGSIIALETSDLLASVISIGTVGMISSIIFLFIGAPDIAIVQVVVEVLVLVVLIRATINKDLTMISGDREFFGMVVSIIMLAVIFIFGIKVFSDIPQFGTNIISLFEGAPSNVYLSRGLKETGAPNIVSSIILDYRAYDTLGEATILFTAILGALAILRQKTKRKTKEK